MCKDIPGIQKEDIDHLRAKAVEVIKETLFPAMCKLLTFLEEEYTKNLRQHCGVGSLSEGLDYYHDALAWHVTLEKSPQEIHELGLQEVARIEGRMLAIMKETGFDGSPAAFVESLRNDSRFCKFQSETDLLNEYKSIINDQITPALKSVFNHVPSHPIVVLKMPCNGPEAMYCQGSSDGKRPGIFYVNTTNPQSRLSFTMMSLALHEALPGHHLQKSWVLETSLPEFCLYNDHRNIFSVPFVFPVYNAYVEGWGLYSEFLGEEMGMSQQKFNRLNWLI